MSSMYPLTHAMHPSPPPPHTAVARTSLPLTFSSSSQRIHNPSPPHAHRHAFVAERTHARRCSRVATHVLLCLCCVLTNVGRCVPSASTPHRHLLWHAPAGHGHTGTPWWPAVTTISHSTSTACTPLSIHSRAAQAKQSQCRMSRATHMQLIGITQLSRAGCFRAS